MDESFILNLVYKDIFFGNVSMSSFFLDCYEILLVRWS